MQQVLGICITVCVIEVTIDLFGGCKVSYLLLTALQPVSRFSFLQTSCDTLPSKCWKGSFSS